MYITFFVKHFYFKKKKWVNIVQKAKGNLEKGKGKKTGKRRNSIRKQVLKKTTFASAMLHPVQTKHQFLGCLLHHHQHQHNNHHHHQ